MPYTDMVEKAKHYNRELKEALQLIFSELNKGQSQKLLKNQRIAELVERFKIEHK